jgi:hypothetical protein
MQLLIAVIFGCVDTMLCRARARASAQLLRLLQWRKTHRPAPGCARACGARTMLFTYEMSHRLTAGLSLHHS